MTNPTLPSTQTPESVQHSDTKPASASDRPSDFDAQAFRTALSQFATGITIITATGADGRRVGVTANSFNSVSLSPPLVLWSLAHKSGSFSGFQTCTHFAVNVLAADQEHLARHFAQHAADKFIGIETVPGMGNSLLLPGALAHFECRKRSVYPEGDHSIFVGEVEHFAFEQKAPLVYQARHYWHSMG